LPVIASCTGDSDGVWDGVDWDGQHARFFAIRETYEAAAEKNYWRTVYGPHPIVRFSSQSLASLESLQKLVAMSFNFDLFDLAGFIGVLLIVIGYLLLQLDKLPSSSLRFSLLNAAGSLLIIVSLLFKFNASAFLIELFWFLISLLGLIKWFISRKRLGDRRKK
jgi:hypothetical protein